MNSKLYGDSSKQRGTGWRDIVKDISAQRAEFEEYYSIMTPYERSVIERGIKGQVQENYGLVVNGVLSEYDAAIQYYQEARRAYDREAIAEINRWEPARYNAELDNYMKRVNLILESDSTTDLFSPIATSAKLEAIFNEAKQSEDKFKQRAACEVIQTCLSKVDGANKIPVNSLVRAAERDLVELRQTEGMNQAQQRINEAWDKFINIREELIDVSKTMGQGDPSGPFASGFLARAIRKVQRDEQTGDLVIYPDDAPEVTGVWEVNKQNAQIAGE